MKLVIAEKPELAKAIADAIADNGVDFTNEFKRNGYIECGDDYVVTSAFGHLFQLKAPHQYDESLKKWSLDSLPIFFDNWEIVPSEGKEKRVCLIGKLLKSADVVIHAGDPDDEGQLLIDEILEYFHYRGKVLRLSTNDNNKDFIKKKLASMDDNSEHISNGFSARARSVADFMVGINYSRFFTLINSGGEKLTVGRVQTPTLGLVVARDYLIENHIKDIYYELFCTLSDNTKDISVKFIPNKENPLVDELGHVKNRASLEKMGRHLIGKSQTAIVSKKDVFEDAPLPLNQEALQRYCGNKFGYTLQETSDAAQELRDKYKAITYNRSSSRNLNEEHYFDAPRVINLVLNILSESHDIDEKKKSKCFAPVKEPHHAIIPTGSFVDISKLPERLANVYRTIAKFYLIQFMEPAHDIKTEISIDLGRGNYLKSSSINCKYLGYRTMFDKSIEDKNNLDLLADGSYTTSVGDFEILEKETKPKPRYTEITLNHDMTCIAKYVTDDSIKELLLRKDKDSSKENGSIGTESTRTAIITSLIEKGYLERSGKKLISTKKGRDLYNILPDEIKGPNVTAKWWQIQEEIKLGESSKEDLYSDVLKTIKSIISDKNTYRINIGSNSARKSLGVCPRCGKEIYESKSGFYCSSIKDDEKCGFFLRNTNPLLDKSKKKITAKMVSDVLSKGFTKCNLKSSAGNSYTGKFVLEDGGKYINLKMDGFIDSKKKK